MTVFSGLRIPEKLVDWSWNAKSVLYTKEDALKVAEENGVEVIYITGDKGAIGAVRRSGASISD